MEEFPDQLAPRGLDEAPKDIEAPIHDEPVTGSERGVSHGVRQRLIELSPHLSRYAEVSAACSCSSVCPTCIGAATAGLVLPMVFGERSQKSN